MRDYKLNFTKLMCIAMIWYATIDVIFALISPNIGNKFFILMFGISYLYYNLVLARCHPKRILANNLLLVVSVGYACWNSGIYYTTHADFYAFVGLIYILTIVADRKYIETLGHYILNHKKSCYAAMICYFGCLFFSVIFKNGFHVDIDFGSNALFGPYPVAHELAYQLTFIYSMAAFIYFHSKSFFLLGIKVLCVGGIALTGARSAFLAIAIIVLIDYYVMKGTSQKWFLTMFGLTAVFYVLFFTDFITSSPVIKKTLINIAEGSVSNNRDRFRTIVLSNYWETTDIIRKIWGVGIDNVRLYLKNDPIVKVGIHAHNDYVNYLAGFGIWGLLIFLVSQFKVFWKMKNFAVQILAFAVLFVLAYTNSLALYMMATPMIGVFIVFAQYCSNRNGFCKERL